MKPQEFESQLKGLDKNLTVESCSRLPGLCAIKWNGKETGIFTPDGEILEEKKPEYSFTFPNGFAVAHPSREEILAKVAGWLVLLKEDPEIALG